MDKMVIRYKITELRTIERDGEWITVVTGKTDSGDVVQLTNIDINFDHPFTFSSGRIRNKD